MTTMRTRCSAERMFYRIQIKGKNEMLQTSAVSHDGNPAHSVTITARFTLDVQDSSNHQTASAVLSAFNARKSSATITITNPDAGTVQIVVAI
jgi:hypothetical protein